MKLRLLLYLSEDLKSLHNAKYVHRYYKYPSSVLVFDNSFCAIETFLECKALPLTNTDEKGGRYLYKAPEILVGQPYIKASDIYSFGMIMHVIGTGTISPSDFPSPFNNFIQCLTFDICFGLRPHIPDNIPKSFKNLMEKCWNTEPDLRPNIHEVHNALLNLWSSIYYYDKNLTSLNLACLEYLAADNNKDYSNSKPQEIIPQQAESSNLRLSDIIDSMKRLVKFIKMNELTTKTPIGSMTSTYILKENGLVFCKRLKNGQLVRDESIKVFIHKLNMQNKPGFRLRIIPILGMSFDESINEHLLVMQYADSGNLRQFLKNHLEKLNWDDKIKLAYQITEGIKYLHDEDIFHYNLHSKNILIHQEEAKIILDIAKNSEISFIDPKLLEDDSYEYDKKSDIYSLGVLMWEISSSKPPFADGKVSENLLKNDLIGGHREEPVPDTPDEYL
ncbi:kinase-like protein [Rhizophagus irregularis]|uniref:Kinase-like protein n=1 Tax=Rhizophagus irregularis TaxID=588596 RepID=A0A2N1MU72_9GLOM|nr:kinase-like protein [Rhizophagus irregularis]